MLLLAGLVVSAFFIFYNLLPNRFEGRTLKGWIQTIRINSPSTSHQERIEQCARVMEANREKAVPEIIERFFHVDRPPRDRFKTTKQAINRWIPFLFKPGQEVYPSDKEILSRLLKNMDLRYDDVYPHAEPLLKSSDPVEHYQGLSLLVYMDDRTDVVVRELDRALKSSVASYQNGALYLASTIGPDAAPLLPSIVSLINPENLNTPRGRMALQALQQIGELHEDAALKLLLIYQNTDLQSQIRILRIFAKVGTDYPGFKDTLEKTMETSTSGHAILLAAETLLKIDPEHAQAQTMFLKMLLSETERKKMNPLVLCSSLSNLGPHADFAKSALAILIQGGNLNEVCGALWAGRETTWSNKLMALGVDRLVMSKNERFKLTLAQTLLRLQPDNAAAMDVLIKIQSTSTLHSKEASAFLNQMEKEDKKLDHDGNHAPIMSP